MRSIASMSEKIYTKNGYVIRYTNFMLIFNEDLESGYDWYISSAAHEKNHAIGIKRKDKNKSITCVDSLNVIRRKYQLY